MVAKSVASRKGKSRKLQNLVAKKLQEIFDTDKNDIKSVPMGVSGIDIWLSNTIRDKHPYGYECKNQEKLSFWSSMRQCVENAESEELTPILVFKKNYREPHVMIRKCDMVDNEYNVTFKIKAQKMNVWNLIDENIFEENDVILIERDEICYVVIKFSDWVSFFE